MALESRDNGNEKTIWQQVVEVFGSNPFAIIERIRSMAGGTVQQPTITLPWSVRGHLQGDAHLHAEHLKSLIESPHWHDVAAYLLLKANDGNTAFQEKLLGDLATAYRKQEGDDVENILSAAHESLPEDTHVLGTKLAQINRYSPDGWYKRMQQLAGLMQQEQATPCLVAYSMLTGLRPFVEQARDGDRLLVMMKHRIEVDKDHSLFLITCQDGHCTTEEWTHAHNTQGITEVHLVDDTIRTGTTLEQTRDCLNEKADFMPHIGEKCYYMVDASNLPPRENGAQPKLPSV